MATFRESEIAISHKLKWQLTRIVAAKQVGAWDENKMSAELLAEQILRTWITQNHPELNTLWAEREAINDRAHKAVNEKAN